MAKTSAMIYQGPGPKSFHYHKPCASYPGCRHRKHGWTPAKQRNGKFPVPWVGDKPGGKR